MKNIERRDFMHSFFILVCIKTLIAEPSFDTVARGKHICSCITCIRLVQLAWKCKSNKEFTFMDEMMLICNRVHLITLSTFSLSTFRKQNQEKCLLVCPSCSHDQEGNVFLFLFFEKPFPVSQLQKEEISYVNSGYGLLPLTLTQLFTQWPITHPIGSRFLIKW